MNKIGVSGQTWLKLDPPLSLPILGFSTLQFLIWVQLLVLRRDKSHMDFDWPPRFRMTNPFQSRASTPKSVATVSSMRNPQPDAPLWIQTTWSSRKLFIMADMVTQGHAGLVALLRWNPHSWGVRLWHLSAYTYAIDHLKRFRGIFNSLTFDSVWRTQKILYQLVCVTLVTIPGILLAGDWHRISAISWW